jgi:endonuclease/exonuclease/phosphatase family metal-dependent hydrolase
MVQLAAADHPDILCLQEVPLWALSHLAAWSGMTAFGEMTARPTVGPVPSIPRVGKAITSLNPGLVRSAFTGQANAILVSSSLLPGDPRHLVLNPRRWRRQQSRRLDLDVVARLAWARERRVVQAVRFCFPDGREGLVANFHGTAYRPDARLADAELLRAATFATALAAPGDPCILAGDFNVFAERSPTLSDLGGPDWAFSEPGPGIDHVLVRNAAVSPVEVWPPERRLVDGRLLSDHAPVEVRVG